MADHTCDDRCSHRATPESLDALGFLVMRIEKGCFGTQHKVNPEGDRFELARHRAWEAGAIRLCTRNPRNLRRDLGGMPAWLA